MIQRLLVKNQLTFDLCELEFSSGLIAFSGASGAGKSVLMQALLSLFGLSQSNASLIEAQVVGDLQLEAFGLQSEEVNVFKCFKDKSIRYFINLQSVSKNSMAQITSSFVSYLSMRSDDDFASEKLLELLDALITQKEPAYSTRLEAFATTFKAYAQERSELEALEAKEKKVEELKEFARFEIAKIEDINPKIGEDEELLSFKRSLSKKEKLQESLAKALEIFQLENYVTEALHLMDKQSGFFDESMNELRALFEEQSQKLEELEEIDVEALLSRIEKIASLKSRHGSIEQVLAYKEQKIQELRSYENISFTKEALELTCKEHLAYLHEHAQQINTKRNAQIATLAKAINAYLDKLYMPQIGLSLEPIALCATGSDSVVLDLATVSVKKISSGEYNRLRLAFVATKSDILQQGSGILILDEIDANLSGKESMSVAKVLQELSRRYQIFAISHQPQLSSKADMHFLVTKEEGKSGVKLLNKQERIEELARMVSAEQITDEARALAQSLLEEV
ncbi:MAG: AAA family ATPase [Sulfurospirillum sp.]|nr:AAA family ATPase [Sulfurospirillum sp.]